LAIGASAAVAGKFRSPAAATTTLAGAQGNAPAARLETELITITPTGFDPAEMTRPQGRVILEVDNRSGLEEVEIRLDRSNGVREKEVRVHRTTLDWSGEVTLRPGIYVLREAGHPDWVCNVTITPQ
jgi:hypothetical protein